MAFAALFLLTSGHLVLVVLAMIPFALKLFASLFPVSLCHTVLGVPCFLLLFSSMVARPLSGLFSKVRRLCWWRVCPGFGWPVSGVAGLWVLVILLSLSRML